MADEHQSLAWYSTHKRALIPLDQRFCYPKSLKRALNQQWFEIRINGDFDAVVRGCADRESTWISEELQDIYALLHRAGWAHSFEAWQQDRMAGGILGITIGGLFIGESMFYRVPEASKVAMVKLVEHLRVKNFLLFDAQLMNPHLARFGAYEVEEEVYSQYLRKAICQSCSMI